jgi:hypothetical protein
VRHALSVPRLLPHVVVHLDMKKIEAPYLLFALIFGFMALIAPYLMEEHRLTLEGRVAMFLFQAGMVFACSLATAKHLHDKWVQEDIDDRQARLRMPKPPGEETDQGEVPPGGLIQSPALHDTAAQSAEPGPSLAFGNTESATPLHSTDTESKSLSH